VVTGIVIMRKGENPSVVLKGVKDKIAELNAHILPAGVKIEPFYDRTWLMDKTLTTVFRNLVEGAMLVSWCCTSSCPTCAPAWPWWW
jgi:cobalt-zinc-cadmium resistance protein CzcA